MAKLRWAYPILIGMTFLLISPPSWGQEVTGDTGEVKSEKTEDSNDLLVLIKVAIQNLMDFNSGKTPSSEEMAEKIKPGSELASSTDRVHSTKVEEMARAEYLPGQEPRSSIETKNEKVKEFRRSEMGF